MLVKDGEMELPVPKEWRSTFCEIVQSFVKADYKLTKHIPMVSKVSSSTAEHIKSYIYDYGEQLIPLPDETWNSSVYLWQDDHWSVLLDL